MTSPETDALRGSFCAGPSRVAKLPAAPSRQPGRGLARMQRWPLQSQLELRALPTAARTARLHITGVLRQWQLEGLAETAELLASELVTNAVRASFLGPREQLLRLRLTSNRHSVLIQVWDGDHHPPLRQDVGPEAEAGRGLLLIEALSAQWGWYAPDGQGGKIVWAVCGRLPARPRASRRRDGEQGTPATAVPGR